MCSKVLVSSRRKPKIPSYGSEYLLQYNRVQFGFEEEEDLLRTGVEVIEPHDLNFCIDSRGGGPGCNTEELTKLRLEYTAQVEELKKIEDALDDHLKQAKQSVINVK